MKDDHPSLTPAEDLLHLLLYKMESSEVEYLYYTEKEKTFTVLTILNCLEKQSYLRKSKDPFSFYRLKD